MSAAIKLLTAQEYLVEERLAFEKSEFVDGEVIAMAGASFSHITIATNLNGMLYEQLRGKSCRPCNSDLRISAPKRNSYFYPDTSVVCGEPIFEDEHQDVVLNPTVVFEVLSPSSAGYDRGLKFFHYRSLESLRDYVLISQDRVLVERFTLSDEKSWVLTDYASPDGVLLLPNIGCKLPLAEIYEGVKFPE